MRERPIPFSAPMVRAILAGTKTQTRRVLKQATGPSLSVGMDDDAPGVAELSWLYGDGPGHDVHEAIKRVPCPYGQPGDRLWVREHWCASSAHDHLPPRDIPAGDAVEYLADGPTRVLTGKARRAFHMPRWASRITLEVTGVRVERLQDISEADAMAEGIERDALTDDWSSYGQVGAALTPKGSYRALWDSINGEREPKHIRRRRSKGKPVHRVPHKHAGAASWSANPWVWVVGFRRV